jgi:outer membrane protein assembly factor BamD (BamD/ComL family)
VVSPLLRHRLVRPAIILLVLASACLATLCRAADPTPPNAFRPADSSNQAAFEHYYNLDYDAAVQDFERILARHPNDPFAVNHLLSAIVVRELYRMGAMNTGEYSNDSFIGQAHRPADPAQKTNWPATPIMSTCSTPVA